jgi:hypothetical protein
MNKAEELKQMASDFFHSTPHGYIYRTNEARGFTTDYKEREIVALMSGFAEQYAQQREKEAYKKGYIDGGIEKNWSVDEIIEELKDIDAFKAAEYFFDNHQNQER